MDVKRSFPRFFKNGRQRIVKNIFCLFGRTCIFYNKIRNHRKVILVELGKYRSVPVTNSCKYFLGRIFFTQSTN